MAYQNKTYVCFDGDTDMCYYRLMCAWKQNDNIPFNFYNAHDLNSARDSSQEETIKAKLRVRLANTKVFIVLVGENTRYLYRFVRWEMEEAIKRQLPIVVVNLNGLRCMDNELCPPILKNAGAVHISFNARIMQHALECWPDDPNHMKREGAFYYSSNIYERYGL